jgi:hypothetical protein
MNEKVLTSSSGSNTVGLVQQSALVDLSLYYCLPSFGANVCVLCWSHGANRIQCSTTADRMMLQSLKQFGQVSQYYSIVAFHDAAVITQQLHASTLCCNMQWPESLPSDS